MTSTGSAQKRMRLSAFDALIRGLANLRANWELTLVLWVQGLALTLLTLFGFVPLLLLIDLDGIATDPASLANWEQTLESAQHLLQAGLPELGPLIAALFATFVIWTLAFFVYCWIQAGVYGVLWTGDRQAPAGVKARIAFRTFSFRDLFGWGRAHVWRYFWLINFFVVLATVWLLAPMLLAGLVYYASQQWGTPAAFGLGCGGALPVVFGWVVIALWSLLAMATAAHPEAGVSAAARESLGILGRRLGACVVLMVLLMIGAFFVGMFFAPLSLVLEVALADKPTVAFAMSAFLSMLQWLASAVVGAWFSAAFVALVRGEQLEIEPDGTR